MNVRSVTSEAWFRLTIQACNLQQQSGRPEREALRPFRLLCF
jgi:hypothetical protein